VSQSRNWGWIWREFDELVFRSHNNTPDETAEYKKAVQYNHHHSVISEEYH